MLPHENISKDDILGGERVAGEGLELLHKAPFQSKALFDEWACWIGWMGGVRGTTSYSIWLGGSVLPPHTHTSRGLPMSSNEWMRIHIDNAEERQRNREGLRAEGGTDRAPMR